MQTISLALLDNVAVCLHMSESTFANSPDCFNSVQLSMSSTSLVTTGDFLKENSQGAVLADSQETLSFGAHYAPSIHISHDTRTR